MRACVDGEAEISRWRLMVLGPAGDGKTSLINRLLGKGFTEEHVVTNALETDCKVEITHCDTEWKEYQTDQFDLLEKSVTQGIGQFIKVATNSQTNRRDFKDAMRFDEILDPDEKNEAKRRLESISNSNDSSYLKFILSIWDLAGQVMYYILHHIFLRWHCVYILVVNLSRPLHSHVPSHELPPHTRQKNMKYFESIEFWLNMVFSHMIKVQENTDMPRVVLVGTHKDKLHHNPDEQDRLAQEYFDEMQSLFLKKAHFQLVHGKFIAVDSKGGDPENYAKLRTLIFELVENHCKLSRPIRWLRLEKKLHEMKQDKSLSELEQHLVSYEKTMEYAKQFHMETAVDLDTFLHYHHLTADITYCSGEGLGNYIVPHPQWLINVLRALITQNQFMPKSQRLVQEKKKLQISGLLNLNGPLLSEIWQKFLHSDPNGQAKQYLINLMVAFDLAVKYDEALYVLPCLLPLAPSDFSSSHCRRESIPSLYYMFHCSRDSYTELSGGAEAYDNFLPHGLFQKLISKCSKEGWAWTKHKYQDAIVFTKDNVHIALQAKSTWIVLSVHPLSCNVLVTYHHYQSVVTSQLLSLLQQYHPNMWFDMAVNPCETTDHDCLLSIGMTSFEEAADNLHGVSCPEHLNSLITCQFAMWFTPEPFRILTEKDLRKLSSDLTDKWKQIKLATELGIPSSKVRGINENTSDIQLASFNMLMFWYDQQIDKADAFVSLCKALQEVGLAGLLNKCLDVNTQCSSKGAKGIKLS